MDARFVLSGQDANSLSTTSDSFAGLTNQVMASAPEACGRQGTRHLVAIHLARYVATWMPNKDSYWVVGGHMRASGVPTTKYKYLVLVQ